MDHQRFDELTRSLATGASRRTTLKLLAGSALGGVLGLLGLEEAAAACRLAGQRCDAAHSCCKGGKCAADGHCKCKQSAGFFACDGPGTRCVNINTSENHCGACGNACGENEICLDGDCTPMCEDGLQNGLETDIDCGGPLCLPCANGQRCTENADCTSDLCEADGTCQDPHTCSDGVKNGGESDVDCGGPSCPGCADGLACFIDRDCANRFCKDGVCGRRASCRNGKKDGNETDIDCGGPDCPPCGEGERCSNRDDCAGILDCVDRAGDGSNQKFCVECTEDTICNALYTDRTTCLRYSCQAVDETCTPGQDTCVDNGILSHCGFNLECACRVTTEGEMACVDSGSGDHSCPANPCTSSAQCVNRYGPGAVCLPPGEPNCLGGCNICALQCP